ncbi:MAG: hypothetical protein KGH66_04240, partial [Candidatus Micrarchaeota archaeon]|nr:hypothetical protein [Candidatus Micrarchaeota archaeon]
DTNTLAEPRARWHRLRLGNVKAGIEELAEALIRMPVVQEVYADDDGRNRIVKVRLVGENNIEYVIGNISHRIYKRFCAAASRAHG